MSKPNKRASLPRRIPLEGGRIVYLVELALAEDLPKRRRESLLKANPGAKEGAPAVYVGETGLSADKRLFNHLTGHQSSWWVRNHGKRLIRLDEGRPDFGHELPEDVGAGLATLGLRSKTDSRGREAEVAAILRAQGWWVVVG